MAANNRIFYACQMVGFRKAFEDGTPTVAKGVQSVGITTNFNLEQAFELGQIQIYENIEGLPDVEVTMEKVLDGYALLFHLASSAAGSNGLVGRSKARADVHLGVYSDEKDAVTDNVATAPDVEVYCSGMFMGSVSYTIPVDGNATESVTLVGNNKEWRTGGTRKLTHAGTGFGTDTPKALTDASGGIQRRENVLLSRSIIPRGVYGVEQSTTTGNALNGGTFPAVHMQNISLSTDFSREDILELGRRTPYFRAPGFPIEVTCDIEAIAVSGDFISAFEEGDPALYSGTASGDNTAEEYIVIALQDGTAFDLGIKNRLSSVSYGGGDAAGGNVSITYSYTNFNDFDVCHTQDPGLALNGGLFNYTPSQSGYIAPTS
jgi:hypothetical protein